MKRERGPSTYRTSCLRLAAAVVIALCGWAHAALAQPTRVGTELQVNTYTFGGQSRQSVAMDADGDFVVAWRSSDQDGDVAGVFFQLYDSAGATEGAEFQVNTYTPYSQGANNFTDRFVAMEDNGDFVVTWPSFNQDGDDRGVFAKRVIAIGEVLGPEFQVNSYTTGEQRESSVASDADGDFVIIWNDEERGILAAQRYDSSGSAAGSQFQVNTSTSFASDGAIDMDDAGNFVVAWESFVPVPRTFALVAQRFDSSGARVGAEFVVSTAGGEAAVGVDGDGDFVIVWTGPEILAQRFDSAGNEVGAEFQVNEHTTGLEGESSVSMTSDGSFVVAWTSQDGDYGGVFARGFGAAGQALGGELAVNTYTTGNQERPSVAMDDEGDFVVTWTSSGQDGSSYGVFAQRFSGGLGPATLEVAIDIKPGTFPNKINLKAGGWVTVAILTTTDFDAFDVDPSTVVFGPADAPADNLVHAQDVDHDGDIDMTLRFRIKDTGIACGDASATLSGETVEGDQIQGSDSVLPAGC